MYYFSFLRMIVRFNFFSLIPRRIEILDCARGGASPIVKFCRKDTYSKVNYKKKNFQKKKKGMIKYFFAGLR